MPFVSQSSSHESSDPFVSQSVAAFAMSQMSSVPFVSQSVRYSG